MMDRKPDDLTKNVLISACVCLVVYLFFSRSMFLFIPVFAAVVYFLWRKGGGQLNSLEDDDPADWWKKGKKFGER